MKEKITALLVLLADIKIPPDVNSCTWISITQFINSVGQFGEFFHKLILQAKSGEIDSYVDA